MLGGREVGGAHTNGPDLGGCHTMHFVLTVVMPSVATFMSAVVGLELTVRDFQRIATFPSLVALTLAV